MKVFLAENAKVNLSAFRTEENCWTGNILDSLAILEILPKLSAIHLPLSTVDVGTGGGFPLLPLALSLPDVRCTGVDSTQKKIDAIGRIAKQMDLKNVELICGRAEVLGRARDHREKYDIVTARAVAEINVLLEYCSPLVKPGGHIVLWKSMNSDRELRDSQKAESVLKCKYTMAHVYELPGDFGKRQLIVFEKTGPLGGTYPRAVGVPKKNPLR